MRSSTTVLVLTLSGALLAAPASFAGPRGGGRAGGGLARGARPASPNGGLSRAGARLAPDAGASSRGAGPFSGSERLAQPGSELLSARPPASGAASRSGSSEPEERGRAAAPTADANRSTGQTALAEDGAQGPRGGSVDVDQTTTGNSTTTTVTAESASGETATHTGTVTQENGYVTYDGSSSTSTGRSSQTHGTAAATDAGLVIGGTTTNNQGSAAGVALVNENGVKAAGIATNGETVKAGAITASDGTVQGASATLTPGSGDGVTVTTTTASAGSGISQTSTTYTPAGTYYVYPVPGGAAIVHHGIYGYPIYWWAATPIVTAMVPIADSGSSATTSTPASYSPVVSYATQSAAVYATSYAPTGLYAERRGDRYYWVPGAARRSTEVDDAILTASRMPAPTAGGTVIWYPINGSSVYLTNEPPLRGIYERTLGDLHGWIPGVSTPNAMQQQALETALTAHAQAGSEALAAAASAGAGG